ITNALRGADLLADVIVAGRGGARPRRSAERPCAGERPHAEEPAGAAEPLRAALADRERRRDAAIRPVYDFTVRLARFRPRRVERLLLASLAGRQAEIDRFLGAF